MSTDPRVAEALELLQEMWDLLDKLGQTPPQAMRKFSRALSVFEQLTNVPCIASDPRCPCNDGDTCNYAATKMTPAFEVPHPDATQLISIADLLPTLSGADPAMLANVCHYLRGLSDRVKALPVARTGPLRVAAEAVSAPVEAVLQCSPTLTECPKCRNDFRKCDLATTPPQAEPSKGPFASNGKRLEKAMDMIVGYASASVSEALAYRSGARLSDYSLSCYPSIKEYLASHFMQADAEIAHLTEELADEKAAVDVLRSELQDRLQKQRAAEAELLEVRRGSEYHPAIGMAAQEYISKLCRQHGGRPYLPLWFKWSECWSAMLAAAPEAPKP
jgi:hypothetical protein